MTEWDDLRKQCPDNPPIAIAQYIESDKVQSYAISGVNYAYNECTFLVFPDKVVQRFISPKVESGFFSNDPTVKTVWDRSTKTFAIEASRSRSPEPPAVAAAQVAETLRTSPPTSHRSRSLTDSNKSKDNRSSSGHTTEQIGRVSREELKRISCYLIEQVNKYLKRRKGVKVANITLAFRRDYKNEWYFLYVEKLKVKKSRGKHREAQSPTGVTANGKEEAKERKGSKLQKSVMTAEEEEKKQPRPGSREKQEEAFREARHRKSNTHYV